MRPNASGGTVFSAACPRLLSRPVTWTVAPAPASAWAAASPIPPVPPVTSATLEARSDFARGEALLKISPKAVCRISIMYCKAAIPDGGGGAKTFVIIKPGPTEYPRVFLANVVEDPRACLPYSSRSYRCTTLVLYFQKRVMTVMGPRSKSSVSNTFIVDWSDHISLAAHPQYTRRTLPPRQRAPERRQLGRQTN